MKIIIWLQGKVCQLLHFFSALRVLVTFLQLWSNALQKEEFMWALSSRKERGREAWQQATGAGSPKITSPSTRRKRKRSGTRLCPEPTPSDDVLPPARLHHLPTQHQQLGTKNSNTWACGEHAEYWKQANKSTKEINTALYAVLRKSTVKFLGTFLSGGCL